VETQRCAGVCNKSRPFPLNWWILAQLGSLENRVYFLPGHPFLHRFLHHKYSGNMEFGWFIAHFALGNICG
jgi:hypothetical protein